MEKSSCPCPYQEDFCPKSANEYKGANLYRVICLGYIDSPFDCKGYQERNSVGAHPKTVGDVPFVCIFKTPQEIVDHLKKYHQKEATPSLPLQILEEIHEAIHSHDADKANDKEREVEDRLSAKFGGKWRFVTNESMNPIWRHYGSNSIRFIGKTKYAEAYLSNGAPSSCMRAIYEKVTDETAWVAGYKAGYAGLKDSKNPYDGLFDASAKYVSWWAGWQWGEHDKRKGLEAKA